MRERREAEPAESSREPGQDVGWEMNSEVDAGKADAQDEQARPGMHDRLHRQGLPFHQVMRRNREGGSREQRMTARKTVRARELDLPRALLWASPLEDVLEQGVDGHGAPGADDDGPRIVTPAATAH